MLTYHSERTQRFWAIAYALLGIIVLGIAVALLKGADQVDSAAIARISIANLDLFQPENVEKTQYILCMLAYPLLFGLFYAVLPRMPRMMLFEVSDGVVLGAEGCALALFVAVNVHAPFTLFGSNLLQARWIPYFFAFFMLFSVSLLHRRLWQTLEKRFHKPLVVAALVMLGLYCVAVASRYLVRDYTLGASYDLHHVNAYYYPVYKTYVGLTQGVDFNNIYGSYHYILALLFHLTGGISLLRFSVVMGCLMLLSYGAITSFLYLVSHNKWIAILGALAIVFVTGVWESLYSAGKFYLQYYPHRWLFLSLFPLLALLVMRAGHAKRRRALVCAGYGLAALAVFWNTETGIVFLGAFFIFNMLLAFMQYGFRDRELYLALGKHLLATALALLLCFASLILITYTRTHQLQSVADFLNGPITCFSLGFSMLKMPHVHPWILLVLYYALNMVKGLRLIRPLRLGALPGMPAQIHAVLSTMLSIVGIGVFVYYQGRSHDHCFAFVLWPAVLLLVLNADQRLKEMSLPGTRTGRAVTLTRYIACMGLVCLLAASAVSSVLDGNTRNKMYGWPQQATTVATGIVQSAKAAGVDIAGEKCDILTSNVADFLYTNLHMDYSTPVTSPVDWLLKSQAGNLRAYLETSVHPLIITPDIDTVLMSWDSVGFAAVLENRFDLIYENDICKVYRPKLS